MCFSIGSAVLQGPIIFRQGRNVSGGLCWIFPVLPVFRVYPFRGDRQGEKRDSRRMLREYRAGNLFRLSQASLRCGNSERSPVECSTSFDDFLFCSTASPKRKESRFRRQRHHGGSVDKSIAQSLSVCTGSRRRRTANRLTDVENKSSHRQEVFSLFFTDQANPPYTRKCERSLRPNPNT